MRTRTARRSEGRSQSRAAPAVALFAMWYSGSSSEVGATLAREGGAP